MLEELAHVAAVKVRIRADADIDYAEKEGPDVPVSAEHGVHHAHNRAQSHYNLLYRHNIRVLELEDIHHYDGGNHSR